MMRNIYIIFSIFFFYFSFSQKKYSNENFSIEYPNNWSINDTLSNGIKLVIIEDKENEKDSIAENFNLIIQDISHYDFSLAEYVKLSIGQIKTACGEDSILVNKLIEKDNITKHRIEFFVKKETKTLYFIQEYYLEDKKAYVLTFTSEIEKKETYKIVSEKIFNSLKIN